MIEPFIHDLIGAFMALGLTIALELWRGKGGRRIYGDWLSAVQPAAYPDMRKWHRQKVHVRPSPFGLRFRPVESPDKLQWEWFPKLHDKIYLAGPWKSTRKGAITRGYMALQMSSNGLYMFGYDYSYPNYGIHLYGRSADDLQSAWPALSKGFREMLPLHETQDAPKGNRRAAPSDTVTDSAT
jgi:hypothetical protein